MKIEDIEMEFTRLSISKCLGQVSRAGTLIGPSRGHLGG